MSQSARMTDIDQEDILTRIRARLEDRPDAGPEIDLHAISKAIDWYEHRHGVRVPRALQRELIQRLAADMSSAERHREETLPDTEARAPLPGRAYLPAFAGRLSGLFREIVPEVMALLDMRALGEQPPAAQRAAIREAVVSVSRTRKLDLNGAETGELIAYVIDDMLGLGPLERLLADDDVSDIMVNGPDRIYVERHGQLHLTDIRFRDNQHVLNIATRMVSAVGRRVDETTPLADARLPDGTRINVAIPPLAIDGATITIRKFQKDQLKLADLVARNSLSPQMAEMLGLAARLRLNILVSGGTGSGKTTLLNAISREIPASERIVTIEDAAELRLQQPHVVRLETRPANIEGNGEVTMRQLFRNALRMRPDRIIIGEVRGEEALDLLQAMNTGHDGSMSTLHANSPREALTRLENMIAMSGVRLPAETVRAQLNDAIHLVVQISRMQDGVRRVVSISEVVGFDGRIVSMQDLFLYRREKTQRSGEVAGRFAATGNLPLFTDRAAEQGLERALRQAVGVSS
ncbi:CpaF family protein [Celeribacter indicus]|uniref:Flp pilus assembly protein, ATPase CpaF n=1 Tax=Celeribacter indicus TaxID=1208324 RepID=A0A0B5DZF7_9RHOB|nr:CpaF family protein [Celeribacter indicus]AJE48838.1 Flp pilus assembly protein, ATPase CpaF [Celeribacter indicus]SDW38765.1 pilus assembly protein CpaF [Celeribacter indicus]